VRNRLQEARLMLLVSPELAPAGELLERVAAALPHVDALQARPKDPRTQPSPAAPCPARATWDLARELLRLVRERRSKALVLVDDRVDVARALLDEGLAGVHLGADDCPVEVARAHLGDEALVGLSTHSFEDVLAAQERRVDYLGFGPVHATPTKGYARGLGATAAWLACEASPLPVFPIGGIDAANAAELARAGRACVGSAILSAGDPAAAARAIRAALESSD
jgi:thiamine-phosphate pyrophosphorylase